MTHNWASSQSNFRSSHSQNIEPRLSPVCLFFPVSETIPNGLFICCKPGGSLEPVNKLTTASNKCYKSNTELQTGMCIIKHEKGAQKCQEQNFGKLRVPS